MSEQIGQSPASTSVASHNPDGLLQVCLEKYYSLRQERHTRLQVHHQTFNYLIVVIGAAVARPWLPAPQQDRSGCCSRAGAILLPLVTGPFLTDSVRS